MKKAIKRVILLRGPSGVGKSTFAETVLFQQYRRNGDGGGFVTASADHYFYKSGQYLFDPLKLPEAHQQCSRDFMEAMREGQEVVVVDNTFIHRWEYENYITVAVRFGYEVEVYEWHVKTIDELKKVVERNVHQVPAAVVCKMVLEFEPFAGAKVVPLQFLY